jgi:hypothetical protein
VGLRAGGPRVNGEFVDFLARAVCRKGETSVWNPLTPSACGEHAVVQEAGNRMIVKRMGCEPGISIEWPPRQNVLTRVIGAVRVHERSGRINTA